MAENKTLKIFGKLFNYKGEYMIECMIVSADELELPFASESNWQRLSKRLKNVTISPSSLQRAYERESTVKIGKENYKVIKVTLSEED